MRFSSARGSTRWSARLCSPGDGWSVCVIERNKIAGGCIRTSTDLTLPGFTHEVLASWHPLFTGSPAYAELKDDLDRRGVTYVNTDLPTGSAFPDGSAAFITGSLEGNVAEFDRLAPGDGAREEGVPRGEHLVCEAWQRQVGGCPDAPAGDGRFAR